MVKSILLISLVSGALLLTINKAHAAEESFKGTAEATSVIVTGNTNTETVGASTKNTWNLTDADLAVVFGNYLSTKSAGTVTGKSWTAGLRYERVLSTDFSAFIQQMSESDPYNGVYTQRDSTDIGGKYSIIKTDTLTWIAELGYRYSLTYVEPTAKTGDVGSANYARLYSEINNKFTTTTSGKLWAEYLLNTKTSDQSLWNAEASFTAVMSAIFSLKTAYLVKHNEGAISPLKKDTTTWATSLIAAY